jgi:tetratricopeptide (TPR) repeat protein
MDLLELGHIGAVDEEIATLGQLAEDLQRPWYRAVTAWIRAGRALFDGSLDEAERLAREGLTTPRLTQHPNTAQTFGVLMYALYREQGRLAEIEPAVRAFIEQYEAIPAWRISLAYIHFSHDRLEEARAEFERLALHNFTDLPNDQTWLIGVVLLSEICAGVGDAERAATLYEMLLPYANRNVITGPIAACTGSAARNLGLLAATMCHGEDAYRHFEEAIRMNSEWGAHVWLAWSRYDYARVLRSRGLPADQRRASDLLKQAAVSAQKRGLKALADKTAKLQALHDS